MLFAMLDHCISRYTARGIHIESYLVLALSCKSIKVWWSSLLEHCPSEERMMKTMIPPQVGMRLWTLQKEKKWKKGQKKKREGPNKKNERREKGQCYYPFSTLVLQSSTMIFMIESLLCCNFHILVGIFHYRTWLVYSNDGLPQSALGLREQASWMHPT